jgi:hypothetical protein
MEDNSENILVEFDYQNISVIDPNKVIDADGKIKDRLIRHEDLVMYANLECAVLPRTKLAVGVPANEAVRTISVGKINFLNPGFKQFLDSNWSDELTGKGAIEGKGVNQPRITVTQNPNLSDDYYINQTLYSNGMEGAVDNGLLGITQINIDYGLEFLPTISITFEDVKGRALFEAGNNSPYAAFFQLPYPIFYLTIKGYIGKAVRLPLMLHTFTSSFDPSSHNFRINCQFYTYKYTIMNQVSWAAMYAVPSMYQLSITKQKTNSTNSSGSSSQTETQTSSLGLQKMKELYQEYKAKGLIDESFPEITILQLKEKLEKLITTIEEKFKKQNLDKLNKLEDYVEKFNEYQSKIYYYLGVDSWKNKWLDSENVFIKNDKQKTVLYRYKPEFNDPNKKSTAITDLDGKIKEYNNKLTSNPVIGKDIPIPINVSTFFQNVNIGDINISETYSKRIGKTFSGLTTSQEYIDYRNSLNKEISDYSNVGQYAGLAFFEGPKSFIELMNKIKEKYEIKKKEVEDGITKEIQAEFSNPTNGLGFQPTIRNVLAIFFAQGEAFLRMMDDVHTKAWDLRDDANRRKAVFNTSTTVQSVDVKNSELDSPVYPWPQIIKESFEEGKEKYVLSYPGDDDLAFQFNAYNPEIWPEVQFVEEFLRGYTQVTPPKFDNGPTGNFLERPNRFSFNSAEFTIGNDVYQNTEEVKFFYEIYERMFLNSFYSKFNRKSIRDNNMQQYVGESESTNIIKAVSDDNPFISQKLKEYNINASIYGGFLRHISNQGEGQSWQNFIRGIINTPYLKNDTDISFFMYKGSILDEDKALPNVGLTNEQPVINYFGGSIINDDYDFTDLYPLTDLDWCKDYLANGKAIQSKIDVFKTSDTLEYNKSIKLVKNKENLLPIVNFNYKNSVFDQTLNLQNLETFYKERKIKEQYTTEGNVVYENYDGKLVARQTTSLFNTPYFANAIQKGLYEFRYSLIEKSPYKAAAYLFLNSLPLATLRDKYRTYNSDGSIITNSYILPSLKKFGAIHEVPYAWVLKYGGIWHRYKKFKLDGVDILDGIWSDTDYIGNYDPAFSSTTTQYNLQVDGTNYDIVLDGVNTLGLNQKTIINTGFYPKLLDDFHVFFKGTKLFSQTSNVEGTYYVTGNTLEVVSLNFAALEPGLILSGSTLAPGTTIIQQLTGTTGSTGTYIISPVQGVVVSPPTAQPFIVTNKPIPGYQNSSIQNALSENFRMVPTTSALINEGPGILSPNSSLICLPWSCYTLTPDKKSIYALPSFGSNVNQAKQECFNNNGSMKINISNNPALHNGAVRLFWKAPNYGYFDNSKLAKPQPDEYIREIFTNEEEQQNFGIFGDPTKYSKISELFTTFTPEILDQFEKQFLLFSKSVYDFESNLQPREEEITVEETYENFQGLMKTMFKTINPEGLTGSALINEITENQKKSFQKTIETFMDYQVVFKYGNPSNFDKKMFYTFSTDFIEDPYTWAGYVQNSPGLLPTQGGTITLAQSKTQSPETWKALETYVGFSEIPELVYTDNGSYITDFFIDMDMEFTENNVKFYAPMIKLYATQKLKDPTLTMNKFFGLMNSYISDGETYLNLILDNTLTSVRNKLANISIKQNQNGVKFKEYLGEISRYEMWDMFKTMNDTWISGADLKSKTLFEDVLLVDRASRDVGQKIFVDIFLLKDRIGQWQHTNNMLGIVNTIFDDNRFTYWILPAYANFYNVQDVSKNPNPRPEGTLEFAKTLFGTHTTVDYRETGAKIVAMYAHVDSKHLAMNGNADYRFRDDAFDMRRASDNPLLESQEGKTNWDKSNKVVGFNVDFGPQNQQIFKQIDIGQDVGEPTAESLEMLNQMANQSRNRTTASQSVSLYNIYRNRSYKCSIDMLGCALVQPTMYFNLRNIPMFSGPYMITNVSHRISENGFDTTIEGQRQPFYSIPAIDSLLQALSTNILTTIKQKIKQEEDSKKVDETNNVIAKTSEATNKVQEGNKSQPSQAQNCSNGLNTSYTNYTAITPTQTTITFGEAYSKITEIVNQQAVQGATPQQISGVINTIFSLIYLGSSNGQSFSSYNYNFAKIPLVFGYGDLANKYFSQSYICLTIQNNQVPFASFSNFESHVKFLSEKYTPKILVSQIVTTPTDSVTNTQIYIEKIAEFSTNSFPNENSNLWQSLTEQVKKQYIEKITEAISFVLSNQPKPVVQPPQEPEIPIFLFEPKLLSASIGKIVNGLIISLNPKADKRRIFQTSLSYSGNSFCTGGVGDINLGTQYVSSDGQTFNMTFNEIFDSLACLGEPINDQVGKYFLNFEMYSTPIKSDGSPDPTRQQFSEIFNLNFEYNQSGTPILI